MRRLQHMGSALCVRGFSLSMHALLSYLGCHRKSRVHRQRGLICHRSLCHEQLAVDRFQHIFGTIMSRRLLQQWRAVILVPIVCIGVSLSIFASASAREITDPARKRELVERARALYFRYPKVGFKGVDCDIAIPLLDRLDSLIALSSAGGARDVVPGRARFAVSILADGGWTLQVMQMEPLGGSDVIGKGRLGVLEACKRMLDGYLRMSRGFLFEDMFEQMGRGYKIFEENGGYRIALEERGQTSEMLLTKQLVLTSVSIRYGGKAMVMGLGYITTGRGLLLNQLSVDGAELTPSFDLEIEYQTIGGMMVPGKLAVMMASEDIAAAFRERYSALREFNGPLTIEFDFLNPRLHGQ